MITCSFVLLGVASYVKERHILSGLAFVAEIACRQYMIVFPAAIALYEFILANARSRQAPNATQKLTQWTLHQRWILPTIATLSLLFWIYLFKGLAPAWILLEDNTPGVQRTIWTIQPGGAIHALASVGGYIVIPELLLFHPLASAKQLFKPRRKIAVIAAILLAYIIIFPPVFDGLGRLIKIALMLPHSFLELVMFYGLSLLACIRFSTPTLMSIIVIFQTIIMMKAYPWDKYVLPVAVFFWYLKAYGLEDKGFATFNRLRARFAYKSHDEPSTLNK